jgi:predicted translin family RNA/ssDNA-binding protein
VGELSLHTENASRQLDEMADKVAKLRDELEKLNDKHVSTTVTTHYQATGLTR